MCLAIPGCIRSINETGTLRMAKVDFGGVSQDICIEWLPEAKVGDYVLAHVGTALSLVDEESAQESLDAFAEIEELLKSERLHERIVE